MSLLSRVFALLLQALPEEFREQHREDIREQLAEETAGRSAWARRRILLRASFDVLWVAARLRLEAALGRARGGGTTMRGSAPLLETVAQDARYCLRSLRRDWSFAVFATLIVGLGIGACATVFSVAWALLARPLPFDEPERLVWISNGEWGRGQDLSGLAVQVAHLQDLRAEGRSFEGVAGYNLFDFAGDHTLTGAGEPERVTRVRVTEGFFELLGVAPQLGRLFTTEELAWGGPPTVLLLHGFWVRRFAADPRVVGSAITIDGAPVTVVGILPAAFDFTTIFAPGSRADYVAPFPLSPETNRIGNTLALLGRLRPDATPEGARVEARRVAARPHADRRNEFDPDVTPLHERLSGSFRSGILLLAGAVGLVMVIVCTNLSNLLLARSATRRREIAIRAALGAGRARLIRQMLTESLILALCGTALGLVLAAAGTRALARMDSSIPLLAQARVDGVVLLVTLGIALLAGLVFGVAPAVRVSASTLQTTLRESGRGATTGRRQSRLRGALVVSEVALACMLLVGAGLLTRSFVHLLDVDLGFRPRNAVALRIDPTAGFASSLERDAYYDEALRLARSAPGLEAVGLTDVLPTGFNRMWCTRPLGSEPADLDPQDSVCPYVRVVSEGYVESMGLSLLAGRDLSASDDDASSPVVVVNEAFAGRVWPGKDAIGQVLQVDNDPRVVVGVVRSTRYLTPEQEPGPEVFVPIRQLPPLWVNATYLIARGPRPPADLASAVGGALRPLDAGLPLNDIVVIQELVDRALSPRRLLAVLLLGFAAFALALASLGIYGVIAYSVKQRRQEIGVRMALGASARKVRGRVLVETLQLALAGVILGLPGAWILGRLMQGLLFGVAPADPLTFVAVPLVLLSVAGLAGYLPAASAARLDPARVLSDSG